MSGALHHSCSVMCIQLYLCTCYVMVTVIDDTELVGSEETMSNILAQCKCTLRSTNFSGLDIESVVGAHRAHKPWPHQNGSYIVGWEDDCLAHYSRGIVIAILAAVTIKYNVICNDHVYCELAEHMHACTCVYIYMNVLRKHTGITVTPCDCEAVCNAKWLSIECMSLS